MAPRRFLRSVACLRGPVEGACPWECSMMMAEASYQTKRSIDAEGTMFFFSGFLSEPILFALGDTLKRKMSLQETSAGTMKRVFSVFVEQVQNVIRYSTETLVNGGEISRISSGVLKVGHRDGCYFVACGNMMRREDVPPLLARLELLESLDLASVKELYMQKIMEPAEASSKGASLGLLEIARRASEPISFDFHDIDETRTFFCIKVWI